MAVCETQPCKSCRSAQYEWRICTLSGARSFEAGYGGRVASNQSLHTLSELGIHFEALLSPLLLLSPCTFPARYTFFARTYSRLVSEL